MGRVLEWPDDPERRAISLNLRPMRHRHPSMQPFDQDLQAADRCVLLTQLEGQLIASLLRTARPHLPSPKAVDDAISLLMPKDAS